MSEINNNESQVDSTGKEVEFKVDGNDVNSVSETSAAETNPQNVAEPAEEKSVAEASSEKKEASDTGKTKKKKPLLVKLLLGIAGFILLIIAALLVAFTVCAFHKKNVLEVIPEGFTAFIHTDSIWDAAEPMMDLEAADLFFSSQEFTDLREPFMEFRASSLRKNPVIGLAASRKADIAVYPKEGSTDIDFVVAVDMSYLSLATRFADKLVPHLDMPEVTFNKENGFIEYRDKPDTKDIYYVKTIRNLVLISANEELLKKAAYTNNNNYSKKTAKLMTSKTDDPIKILVDSKRFADSAVKDTPMLSRLSNVISDEDLSEVALRITKDTITLDAKLPLKKENADRESLKKIINRTSTEPELLSKLTENVQYYTILNAGTLAELKDVAFNYLPKEKKANDLWRTGNKVSKSVFGLTIEEMIFSWTGGEFAALGIENQNDPVFAFRIADENQRGLVFEKFISSIIIQEDTSLILDGMRMRQLMLPDFLQNIIALFDVNIPRPYYMVKDGFIYFSENPECLASINGAAKKDLKLKQSEAYRTVVGSTSDENTIDLYYNLERSIPFFLRSNAGLSQVLQLYSNGRFCLSLHDNYVKVELKAVSKHILDLHCVPGFPVALDGKPDGNLQKSGNAIFWLEDEATVKTMGIPSTKIRSAKFKNLGNKLYIKAGSTSLNKNGCLWIVSSNGKVLLVDNKLDVIKGFGEEVNIGVRPAAEPACTKEKLIIPGEDKSLYFVDARGKVTSRKLELTGSFKSAPAVFEDTIAVYDKSFMGSIILLKENSKQTTKLPVSGIAFGTPSFVKKGNDLYTGFVTQNGMMTIWKNGASPVSVNLKGQFFKNVVADGEYFYALSYGASLYRISVTGKVLSVHVPYNSAKDGFINAYKGTVYVTPDSNVIYGFDENLELVYGYPLLGWGKPAFADVNGDNKDECFVLSIDKKLYAWNIK